MMDGEGRRKDKMDRGDDHPDFSQNSERLKPGGY